MINFKQFLESNQMRTSREQHLHDTTASDIPHEDLLHIKRHYTNGSHVLNHKLMYNKPLDDNEKKVHHLIKKHARPVGKNIHVYSGVSDDFVDHVHDSKDKIVHSPAHLSTSSRIKMAQSFADGDDYQDGHIFHIAMKPKDKGLYTAKSGAGRSSEHELIIPAGTKLKYSHTTHHEMEHKSDEDENDDDHDYRQSYQIHHFKIHSQD